MNAVLRAFMQARLAGVLEGPEDSVEAKMDLSRFGAAPLIA